jgi:hypothetical protein
MSSESTVVDAINDLTRVTIALSGKITTKSDAIRKLNELAIPQARIAAILAMPVKDVSSLLTKDKKKTGKEVEFNG